MRELYLSGNELRGPLPSCITNLSRLEALRISHNKLTGELPHELARWSRMRVFDVGYNRFRGRLPAQLGLRKAPALSVEAEARVTYPRPMAAISARLLRDGDAAASLRCGGLLRCGLLICGLLICGLLRCG